MFQEIRDNIPGLAAWMESCYSSLHLQNDIILSRCGSPRPIRFCFDLVERIQEEVVPGLGLNTWYLGTLCGHPEDLAKALRIVKEAGDFT